MTGDSVVLVTGAGAGIGAATARQFADDGWTVYATDIETPLPERIAGRCRTAELDVTDPEQCGAVLDRIEDETGRLDCLVNNAGYAVPGPLEDVDGDDVERCFDVLVHGPHRLVQAALPSLRETGGRLIAVSSVLARSAYPGLGAYGAGKAALSSMHDSLRMELADSPVAVSVVEPGWVDTEFADRALSALDDERSPEYDAVYEALEEGWVLDGGPLATPPEQVAEAIQRAATDPDPSAHYPVGAFATFVYWSHWLPARVSDPIATWFGRVTAELDDW